MYVCMKRRTTREDCLFNFEICRTATGGPLSVLSVLDGHASSARDVARKVRRPVGWQTEIL